MSPHEPSNPTSVGSEIYMRYIDKAEAQGKDIKIVLRNFVGSQLFHKVETEETMPNSFKSPQLLCYLHHTKTKNGELQSHFFYEHS